jgi:hypothetical protein
MQLSSILSACARNGVTVTQPRDRKDYYVLTKGENVLEFYTNSDGFVGHLTYRHPDTDAMTDLFMDSYFDTIKSAMHFLNPTGDLVKPAKPALNDAPMVHVENVTVTKNEEKGGIEIRFPQKPSQEVINNLKANGYRWSSFASVWWKRYSDADFNKACETYMEKVEV